MIDMKKVQRAVKKAGSSSGIRNLSVKEADGMVEIHGEAEDHSAKEKAFEAISKSAGDAAVVNRIAIVGRNVSFDIHAQETVKTSAFDIHSEPTMRIHSVRKGETLESIAEHYFGKTEHARKILDANRDQLKDPGALYEGLVIKIPQ